MILEGLWLPEIGWLGSFVGDAGELRQSLLSLGVLIIAAKLAEGLFPPTAPELHHCLRCSWDPIGAGAGIVGGVVGTSNRSY